MFIKLSGSPAGMLAINPDTITHFEVAGPSSTKIFFVGGMSALALGKIDDVLNHIAQPPRDAVLR